MENDEVNSSPLQPTDFSSQSTENTESEAIDFDSNQNNQENLTDDLTFEEDETASEDNSEETEPLQLSEEETNLMQDENTEAVPEQKDESEDISLEDDVFSFLRFDDNNSDKSEENKTLDDIF